GGNRLENDRFVAGARADGVKRTGFTLLLVQAAQALCERNRVGIARRDDAVADVDDLRIWLALLEYRIECSVKVGPAQRMAAREEIAQCSDVAWLGVDGLVEDPVALHVA